jgi:hypothetical protein
MTGCKGSILLKNSLSGEKGGRVENVGLHNRATFSDLDSGKESLYPEKISFRVFQQNRSSALGDECLLPGSKTSLTAFRRWIRREDGRVAALTSHLPFKAIKVCYGTFC